MIYPHFVTVINIIDKEVRAWCKENGIPIRKKYYRRNRDITAIDGMFKEMYVHTLNTLTSSKKVWVTQIPRQSPFLIRSVHNNHNRKLNKLAHAHAHTRALAFMSPMMYNRTYAFKTEEDAVAFKLRWV